MPTIKCKGKSYKVDDEGYLEDWQDWSEGLAEHMAKKDDMELTDAHWEVIRFLRSYYEKYQIAPMIKMLSAEFTNALGKEKGRIKYLYEFFQRSPAERAVRYAGLPRPTGVV